MPKLPNHDALPQALRHMNPDYDPYAAVTDPAKLQEFPLTGRIYFRGSTDEWVMEVSGTINGTSFDARHTAPKALSPEDVPGLPHLYPEPIDRTSEMEDLVEQIQYRQAHAVQDEKDQNLDLSQETHLLLLLRDKQNGVGTES